MRHTHRRSKQHFAHKVTVAHGVHRVGADAPNHPQLPSHPAPINSERVSRQCPRPEGKACNAREGSSQDLRVPLPGGGMTKKPMGETDWLGALEVSEACVAGEEKHEWVAVCGWLVG